MEIFAIAAREQYRFATPRGLVTVEALWQMPLSAKDGFDLNNTAKAVNNELKAMAEESFVDEKPVPGRQHTENRLEIVKYVIATKMAENTAARSAIAKKEEKQKLLTLLDDKNNEELKKLSPAELRARIEALG
jgi:hypothetical protein